MSAARDIPVRVDIETLRLTYRPPLAIAPLVRFLADRAIPGVEAWDGRTFRRSVRVGEGQPAVISLTPQLEPECVLLGVASADAASVVGTARRLLDLDAQPEAVDAALAEDPALRALVRATPGIRRPGAVDGFELAVRAVLGQQVTVRAARTFAGRIAAAYGARLGSPGDAQVTYLFPTAAELADARLEGIGLTTRRAATLRELAELVAAGDLDLSGLTDAGATIDKLLAVAGIGPWTASYIAMRALRDPDAFLVEDLGVRKGFEAIGLPTSRAAIQRHAERWRPWRAYAVMHLWNAEAA